MSNDKTVKEQTPEKKLNKRNKKNVISLHLITEQRLKELIRANDNRKTLIKKQQRQTSQ